MAFRIRFEEEAVEHLDHLTAKERSTILSQIEKQLINQPNVATQHRKQLRPNPLAKWQLSVEALRVFYDLDEAENEVIVLAIGKKLGNRLIIGRKEYKL